MNGIDLKKELEYDYNKYISEIENNRNRINNYIEESLNLRPQISVSPFAISSSSWYANEDREQNLYNDAHDSTEERRRELAYKQSVLEKWINKGLFSERVAFSNGDNFYFTTAEGIEEGKFGNDSYIYSYWSNKPIKEIRTLDIGKKSKNIKFDFGELILKAKFKPIKDDLIDILYETKNNNKRYKSAKDEINKIPKVIEEKISIENFFKLRFEFSALGVQAKALYDTKNSIIEGSAGTGKSTIALQKLKMAKVNQKISEDRMAVIVKNEQSIEFFYTLLHSKELSLKKVKITLVKELLEDLKINNLRLEDIDKAKAIAIKLKKEINDFIRDKNLENLKKHHFTISNKIDKDKIISYLKKLRDKKIIKFKEKKIKDIENISLDLLKSIIENGVASSNFEEVKSLVIVRENINYLKRQKRNEKKLKQLDINSQEYEDIKNKLLIPFKISLSDRQLLENVLSKIYFEETFIKTTFLSIFSEVESNLILLYLLDKRPKLYSLLLVDEAQDYTLVELELLRLLTDKIILTGDIWQNISNFGIKRWRDIIDFDKIYENNIFTLKHNFRQTYQLANASYNYRQLLLGGELEDIGSDYYDDEKELNGKPYELVKIIFNQDNIKEYIENKIEYIKNRFTSQIPIVIIYKTEEEKEQYKRNLSSFRLSYDTEQTKGIDVILVDILEAKGKQFPIVVSYIDELTDREIYLIMTRGQFEVEFLTNKKELMNEKIKILVNKKWICFENKDGMEKCKLCGIITPNLAIHRPYCTGVWGKNIVSYEKNKKINNSKKEKVKNKKDELQKENTPKLKEQIPKHQAKTTQYDEKLNPDIITDEEQYQKEFIQKVQEDIKEFEEAKQNEIVQEIVVVRKKSNTKKSKEQRQKIKDYLFDTYKGYCQICGFTFRKVEDGKNSFEMFNWNDKRVVKKKKSFITTADSLCLCKNCSANIKWGAFEPIFIDKINVIENFANKSLDEVKEAICVKLEDNIVKKFKDDYEWEDIYALEIIVNDEPKNIYMTNGHLIQFIAYLQLEER